MKKRDFFVLSNTMVYREIPKHHLVMVGKFQIQFMNLDTNELEYEIIDFEGFKAFTINGIELDPDQQDKTVQYFKEVFGIDIITELENDVADVVNDLGIEEFFTQTTGLKLA
jgi:hypothetical protein